MFGRHLTFFLFKIVNPNLNSEPTKNRNECFSTEVMGAQYLCLTVFHDSAIPPDDFVANCIIPFEDILAREEKDGVHDLWVSQREKVFLMIVRIKLIVSTKTRSISSRPAVYILQSS